MPEKQLADRQKKLLAEAREWLKQRQIVLKEKEAQVEMLNEECSLLRREMKPLEDWIRTMEGQQVEDLTDKQEASLSGIISCKEQELRGDRLREEVVNLLKEAHPEEMYYRDILTHLAEKGFKVSGKNPGLNLVAHLSKEPRVEKGCKRGMYRLSE